MLCCACVQFSQVILRNMLNCASSARKIWAILSRGGRHFDRERSFRHERQLIPESVTSACGFGGFLIELNELVAKSSSPCR